MLRRRQSTPRYWSGILYRARTSGDRCWTARGHGTTARSHSGKWAARGGHRRPFRAGWELGVCSVVLRTPLDRPSSSVPFGETWRYSAGGMGRTSISALAGPRVARYTTPAIRDWRGDTAGTGSPCSRTETSVFAASDEPPVPVSTVLATLPLPIVIYVVSRCKVTVCMESRGCDPVRRSKLSALGEWLRRTRHRVVPPSPSGSGSDDARHHGHESGEPRQ